MALADLKSGKFVRLATVRYLPATKLLPFSYRTVVKSVHIKK